MLKNRITLTLVNNVFLCINGYWNSSYAPSIGTRVTYEKCMQALIMLFKQWIENQYNGEVVVGGGWYVMRIIAEVLIANIDWNIWQEKRFS